MNNNAQIRQLFTPLLICSAVLLGACGEGTVGSTTPRDTTLTLDPTLTTPTPNQTGVNTLPTITITVEEELDFASVTSANVHLMPGAGHGKGEASEEDEDDAMLNNDPIPGIVNLGVDNKTITFQPQKALDQGRMYHVHLADVLLKGGRPVTNGIDTIEYNFTTSHAHEYKRLEYAETGNTIVEDRRTQVVANKRIKRTVYEGQSTGGAGTIKYVRQYDSVLPGTSFIANYYNLDADGDVGRYERDITQNGKTYKVRFKQPTEVAITPLPNVTEYDVRNFWTPGQAHGANHVISFQFEPIDGTKDGYTVWPATGDPEAHPDFTLDDGQLMEMNHGAPISGNSGGLNYQHRHIFYGDLGADGEIDFKDGQPFPDDDRVSVYHTRDLQNYRRTHSWSWNGEANDGTLRGHGIDKILFTDDDLAYRVRVYIYDFEGRIVQRVTYEMPEGRSKAPYGYTRGEWTANLTASGYRGSVPGAVGQNLTFVPEYKSPNGSTTPYKVHSYRIYNYVPDNSGTNAKQLDTVDVYHENEGKTALFKEQKRFYSINPNIDGHSTQWDSIN